MLRTALVFVALASSIHLAHAQADVDEPLYSCRVPAAGTKLSVNFAPETALKDLAAWVTGFTCKNIVFSADVPRRATKVTIIAPGKMTPKQALALFVDAVEATGLVVQIKPDTIIIKLGPNMPKGCPDTTVSSTGGELGGSPFGKSPKAVEAPEPSEADTQALIDKGIKKIDDTHYEITAAAIDAILLNPMAVGKAARVVPAVKNSKPDGFKIYAITPSSVFGKLGFSNGDTIQSINGMPLDSADQALEAYTKLREATKIDVSITRRGKPLTISIKVTR